MDEEKSRRDSEVERQNARLWDAVTATRSHIELAESMLPTNGDGAKEVLQHLLKDMALRGL